MAKSAKKTHQTSPSPEFKARKAKHNRSASTNTSLNDIRTLSDLRQNSNLWYKLRVLINDLKNMAKDRTCENRTLQTTDALYISEPCFSDEEATTVKAVIVDDCAEPKLSVEMAVTSRLESFFEKRRASGDSRPCGPHDMVPVYLSVFGMGREEIEKESFVSRVRRSGLEGL